MQATGISPMVRPAFAQTAVLPKMPGPLSAQATALPLQARVADWLSRTGAAFAGGDPAAPPSPPRGMQRTAGTEGAQHNEPGRRASLEEVATPVENESSAAQEPPHLTPVLNQIGTIYRNRVEGLRRRGMPVAAANLEHFLDGSGEPRKLPRDEAIKLEPVRHSELENMKRFEEETFCGRSERNENVKVLQKMKPGSRHRFS